MSEWIKCEEKLPEIGKWCLVVWNGTVQQVAYSFQGSSWVASSIDTDEAPVGEFSHWQLLPAPPEVSHE